ncbi:MAG: winged helix-turn-helix domain-containing protein [Candidatus Woesearchaeota archaeon]
MKSKRSRLEVIFDILSIVKKHHQIKKTPLLRFSNLSYENFNNYYEELLEKEFVIEEVDSKNKMSISLSSKGHEFLTKFKDIQKFLKEFELD